MLASTQAENTGDDDPESDKVKVLTNENHRLTQRANQLEVDMILLDEAKKELKTETESLKAALKNENTSKETFEKAATDKTIKLSKEIEMLKLMDC